MPSYPLNAVPPKHGPAATHGLLPSASGHTQRLHGEHRSAGVRAREEFIVSRSSHAECTGTNSVRCQCGVLSSTPAPVPSCVLDSVAW